MMRVLSLGAGVQSTTLALMAAAGEIGPMPDAAIFADTGWEPKAVYEHLARLTEALPFPVHQVSGGNIRADIIASTQAVGKRFASVPWFTANAGMGRRHCTRDFKVRPLERKQRDLLGYMPRTRIPAGSIEVWIGISMDEAIRMKPARNKWQVNRWPLIEQRINRRQCIEWLAERGWAAPKSACLGCPYHDNSQWRALKDNPAEWADIVAVDKALRDSGTNRGMRHHQYMHRSLKPIDEVDLSTAEERGQLDMFNNECEGLCGV